jgi:predicted nuclease of restriction endonuclease-like (RecB) superfamily
MSELPAKDYGDFLVAVKTRIRQAQYQALRAANKELLSLYWDLGESIHRKQEALGWGKAVVQTLADDLQAEFPGRNGFSATNLWLMRQFYAEYQDQPKLQPLVGEISWAKNKTVVEYALRTAGRPIGVATYTVVPQLPATYRDQLPSPEAIAERLRLWAAESAQKAADDQAEGAE